MDKIQAWLCDAQHSSVLKAPECMWSAQGTCVHMEYARHVSAYGVRRVHEVMVYCRRRQSVQAIDVPLQCHCMTVDQLQDQLHASFVDNDLLLCHRAQRIQLKTVGVSYGMIHTSILLTIIAMLLLLPVDRQSITQFCAGCVRRAMQIYCFRSHAVLILRHAGSFAIVAPIWAVWVQQLQLSCSFAKCKWQLLTSVCRAFK